MSVKQTSRLGRHRADAFIPFEALSTHRVAYAERPHVAYLLGAALFAIGVMLNLVSRSEGWLPNVLLGAGFSSALMLIWLAQRSRWTGFPPLVVLGQSDRARDFLAEVVRRRGGHIVGRAVAEADLTTAFRVIRGWRGSGSISDEEARRLWELAQSMSDEPGGYL